MIQKMDTLALKVKSGIAIGFNELREWRRRQKQMIKDYKAAHKRKEFPVLHTVEDVESMDGNSKKTFLRYCLSLIAKQHPRHHDLLVLILANAKETEAETYKCVLQIIKKHGGNMTLEGLKRGEAEALRILSETIERLRAKGIPIFSDLPA